MDRRSDRNLMSADSVCEALGLPEIPAIWRETWPQSEASFRSDGDSFLDPDWAAQTCETLRMSDEVAQVLFETAAEIARSPALKRLAWHCHWLVCLSGLDTRVNEWPALPEDGPLAVAMLYAAVCLAGVPHMQRLHEARGIDPEIGIRTMADLEIWAQENKRRQGTWGFRHFSWLVHRLQGRLFWLGRLQYLPGRYNDHLRFYRRESTGEVVGLAEGGLLFREDGQFADADHGIERGGLWLSDLAIAADTIRGNPVAPEGRVLRQELTLDRSEWHEILRHGDPVMTVHIPATGRMDPAACGESFREAVEFFRRHFPDVPYRAFTCHSWLLDPQFEVMTPPPANIVSFLRNWYLHPVPGASDGQTWERVFDVFDGARPALDDAPQDTSLQRAAIAFMKSTGPCRSGGSVLFPEDLDWGNEVYRTRCRATGLPKG